MVLETYIKITDWQRTILMKCCNSILQCRAKLDDLQGVRIELFLRKIAQDYDMEITTIFQVHAWAEEVEILYKHAYFTTDVMLGVLNVTFGTSCQT